MIEGLDLLVAADGGIRYGTLLLDTCRSEVAHEAAILDGSCLPTECYASKGIRLRGIL